MLLGCLITSIALEQFIPTTFAFDAFRTLIGAIICCAALAVFTAAVRRFGQAGTSVQTSQPSTAVVRDGIYRFTRNPIHLSMCIMMAGLGLLLNSLWVVLILLVFVPVLQFGVIVSEEVYMERKFGSTYTDYKTRARRWP